MPERCLNRRGYEAEENVISLLNRNEPTRDALEWWIHRQTKIYVLSYPKCGRTWLRLMIGKALDEHYQLGIANPMELGHIPAGLGAARLPAGGAPSASLALRGGPTRARRAVTRTRRLASIAVTTMQPTSIAGRGSRAGARLPRAVTRTRRLVSIAVTSFSSVPADNKA